MNIADVMIVAIDMHVSWDVALSQSLCSSGDCTLPVLVACASAEVAFFKRMTDCSRVSAEYLRRMEESFWGSTSAESGDLFLKRQAASESHHTALDIGVSESNRL